MLSHYSYGDSLKYKAAVFLIKNIPSQYSRKFIDYNMFSAVFDSLNFYDVVTSPILGQVVNIQSQI